MYFYTLSERSRFNAGAFLSRLKVSVIVLPAGERGPFSRSKAPIFYVRIISLVSMVPNPLPQMLSADTHFKLVWPCTIYIQCEKQHRCLL